MGTVIITGANGSLGLPAVSYLLSQYPTYTLVCTVRNDSDEDANTRKLREAVAGNKNASIRKLDLASLSAVRQFADEIRSEIASGQLPPLHAVIWNAMCWTLLGGLKLSADGYERSLAVNHLSHFAMTLQLLDSFDKANGRIIFLGSDSHGKSDLQELPTVLPDDLDLIVHPTPDEEGQAVARGFQRYGISKLVMIMTMYELNRRLKAVRGESCRALDFSI
jgi:NAD(P)-dependent dehydrogenase (short-subunit alcohol dehydrogenase family)